MSEQEFEQSPLTQSISQNGHTVQVDIYRGDHGGWILEIVDAANNSTLWEDEFESDQDALDEAKAAIDEEGIEAFIGSNDE